MNVYNKNIPSGSLDFDNNSRDIEATDYRYSLNIRNGVAYVKRKSGATFVKGNVLIPKVIYSYGTPTGNSKSIGSFEDKQTNSIIFFNRNVNGQSGIYQYFPQLIDVNNPFGEIHQLSFFDFGWASSTQITSINTITGKSGELLYWCDNVRGRKINTTKADIVGKMKTWTVYFGKNSTQFQQSFVFNINDINTGVTIHTQIIDTTAQTQITSIGLLFEYLATAINADPISSLYITAEACDCKLNIAEVQTNKVNVIWVNQDIMNVPQNWYGLTFTERMFDEAKYPSLLSPLVSFGINSAKQFNNVKNQVWQFRVNLFYDDFEESVLSPFTQVPVNELVNGGLQIQSYNYLHIDFNDATIPDNLTLIDRMSVTARSGNNGVEQEVAQLEICDFLDFDYTNHVWICGYDFYNDTIANVVDTAYAEKLNDGVPIQNAAQTIVQNRMVKGGILSGEDVIPCLDISVKQEFSNDDDVYYTISFQVYIYNQYAYIANQPILSPDIENSALNPTQINTPEMQNRFTGCIYKYPPIDPANPTIYEQYPQWGGIASNNVSQHKTSGKDQYLDQLIPLGGFLFYSAGTDFWAVTKQEQLAGGNPTTQLPVVANSILDAGSLGLIEDFLNVPLGNTIKQNISIRVKKGRNLIRGASHWCSFGDVLSKGPMYNLNNGREYQTTSTNVFGVNPFVNGVFQGYDFNKYEIEVDVQSDMFIGEFAIEDLRSINNTLEFYSSYTGYVLDSIGGTSGLQLQKAPRMEYQQVCLPQLQFRNTSSTVRDGIPTRCQQFRRLSDHNGYFYFKIWTPTFKGSQVFNLTAQEGAGIIPFVLGYSTVPFIDPTLFDSAVSALYGSTGSILNELVTNTLQLFTPQPFTITQSSYYPANDFSAYQLLLYPFNTDNIKTDIVGNFSDTLGNPIYNGVAIYGRTGRQVFSDINGNFSMLVYGVYDSVFGFVVEYTSGGFPPPETYVGIFLSPIRTVDDLLLLYSNTTENISNDPQSIGVFDFTIYTPTNPLPLPLPMSLSANANPYGKALKRGGTYQIGIRYQDIAGRETSVITNQSSIMYIPFITEDLHNYFPSQYPANTFIYGKPTITLTLNFKPPIWAYSYNIMLTLNQYESDYLQWVANQITYVSNIGYSQAEINVEATTTTTTSTSGPITKSKAVTTPTSVYNPPVITSYQAGDASNIYLSLSNLVDYQNSNPSSILSYTYQAGDRVRLIRDANGNRYTQLYETEVVGYDTAQNSIIISNQVGFPQLFAGCLFEVLHVRYKTDKDEQIYYEVGESFLCTAPNTPANDHSVNPIRLTCGDTYWRDREYLVDDPTDSIFTSTAYIIEDPNLSDFFASASWDIGRIGVFDPFFKQTYKETDIIVSNLYATDSNLNGFNTFEALNRKTLDKMYGNIQRLVMLGDVLHVICENKSISDYIGQRVLSESKELNGPVAIANDFLGTERAQIKDLGTQHPASVSVKDGYLYGLDARRAIPWRDANDGMTDIAKAPNGKGVATMQSYFKELCSQPLWSITSGIDKFYNEYILTVYQKLFTYMIGTFTFVYENGNVGMNLPQSLFTLGISDGDDVIIDAVLPNGSSTTLYGIASIPDIHGNFLLVTGTDTHVRLTKVRLSYRGAGETIAWQEDKNRWSTFYSYLPECYGMLGDLLYSYNGGQLWVHDQNEIRNNFYNTQYTGSITPVFNTRPDLIQIWLSLGLESIQADGNNNWACTMQNDYGQQSKLVPQNFRKKERQWFSDVKRDSTDTSVAIPLVNGKRMRSETLEVALTSDYTGDVILRLMTLLSIVSQRSGH